MQRNTPPRRRADALRYAPLVWVLLFGAFAFSGCAEDRPEINRVQPNALEKSLLDGEWYYQRTVVDVPSGDGFTHVGATDFGGLNRITWDIQENFIYARRSIELIRGADDLEQTQEDYKGEVVAAYRILKHFDIVRAYNTSTGEELNILEENSVDRPWYERKHMRVDWSQNLVRNYDLDFEAASVEPVSYFVQDTEDGTPHADAPVFDKNGNYFDITNKIFARAGTTFLEGYGDIPLCWLRGNEFQECGAGEYTIRNSFMKINPLHEYEPLVYKGKPTDVFGFFWTDRYNYDSQRGIREQDRERYLNRHNLWLRSFDSNGNPLPYAERTLKPIVYHVNRDMPDDLKPIVQKVADQWNGVFNDTVTGLGYTLRDGQRTFIACVNNPVQAGDPVECGVEGTSPRIGDIRYSFMAYIPKYMKYGLLGLGPSNTDPETGEILSGMAYVYHHNNVAAFRTEEMIELLNGSKDPSDYIDGVDLADWVERVRSGDGLSGGRTHGLEDSGAMVHELTHGASSRFWHGHHHEITEADEQEQRERGLDRWLEPHLDTMYQGGLLNGEHNVRRQQLENLRDTYLEDLLMNEEMLMAGGHVPGTPVQDAHLDQASVARGGFGQLIKRREALRLQFAESRNMYLPEMADDALIGLARELKDAPPEVVYQTVRESIYTAVLAHEVGHSLGLMHNFGGSDDAINYFDDYWKLRDDGNVGPRLEDPISQAELDGKIYNYAYSSVMDYAGRYTIDGEGIGKYDRAAILFGYAQKVEVFRDNSGVQDFTLREWFERDGELLSFTNFGPRATHYTTLYNNMGPKMYEQSNRMLVDVSDLSPDYSTAKVGDETYARVPYIYCSHNRANLGDSCLTRDFGADSQERMKNMLDDLNTWYIARNFPRGIVGSEPFNYVGRYYSRVYDRMKNWHSIYGLYAALLPRFYGADTLEAFYTDPVNGWGGQTWAVQNAFNYLVQTLLTPNIGAYSGPFTQVDGSVLMQTGFNQPTVNLDVTEARYYSTSWGDGDRECGYQWYECLHHIGFYLDKIMAIEALTDSTTNFVARATPEDIRQWEVSYYSTFGPQISKINRAIMSQRWDTVAPFVPPNGELTYPNYAGDLETQWARPIDPSATFTIQLYWQVMGQARFPTTFNRAFLEESRIYIKGTAREPDVGEENMVEFVDPLSNLIYTAVVRPNPSAAESMIRRANALKAHSSYCDDGTKNAFVDDDCSQANPNYRFNADFDLLQYIQLLQVMTDMDSMMTYGDPYNP